MKNKKLIAAFSAAAITLSVGLSAFTACGGGCDHVFNYKVRIPATCMSAGVEEGVCGICGDTVERVIPLDGNAHGYGEWNIVKPTEETEGSASNVCSHNSAHVVNVTLPKLTEDGAGYTSSGVTLPPTALKNGERTFVLENAAGDIRFTIPVPARGVQTVADAVEVAVAGAEQVRYAYGKVSDNKDKSISEVFYEYGENYTHSIDNSDYNERWYSYDANGRFFGVRAEGITYNFDENGKPASVKNSSGSSSKPKQDNDPDARYMKGVRSTLLYSKSTTQEYFGAEDCLNEIYKWKLASVNGDAYEEIIKNDASGETVYKFGFGVFNSPYFCEIKVEFTLTGTYALKHFVLESYDYDNTYELKYEQDPITKYWRLVNGAAPGAVEFIEFTNVTESELPPEEAASKPENPYPANFLQLKSMDVIVSSTGKTVDGDTVITVNADALVSFVYFTDIENVGPGINDISYDTVSVYHRTATGDVELNYDYSLTGIAVLIDNNTNVRLRSRIAGDLDIVLKSQSGNFEKVLKVYVNPVAPTKIMPSYHKYGNTGYTWQKTDGNSISATVYVNQPLPFKAEVPKDEINFASAEITAKVTSGNTATSAITDLPDGIKEFKATATGNYTITLSSVLATSKKCTVTVTVLPPKQSAELFGNTDYTGNLNYPSRGQVAVHCDATAGTITVNFRNGEQIEMLHIDSYNAATGELVTSHRGGAELNFKVTVNEAYDLVLSHPTGFGDTVESVILVKK